MTIKADGKIGIGTTSPGFPLDTVFTNANSSSFSTSLAMGSGANADLYALHLQNLGTGNCETGLLFSAGNTQFGQWSVNCLKTGAFVGDLAFRTRTGSATSTERMRIDSSGNVGLGVTSISDARFRIKGANNSTTQFDDGLMVTSNNETVYKKFSWAGIEVKGGLTFNETNSGSLVETMRIDTSGNVGIGTTSPSAKLNIEDGSGDDFQGIRIINTHNDANAIDTSFIRLGITNVGGEKTTQIAAVQESNGGNAVALRFSTNSSGSNNGETEKMRILGSGNVGIGTSNPACGLHIDNPSDAAITQILDTDNTAVKLVFRNSTETGNAVQIGANGSRLVFVTGSNERGAFDSDGRLLLGTTTSQGSTNADDLQIGANDQSNQTGITLGSASGSSIRFADAGSDTAGAINYIHSDDTMRFTAGGSERMRIDSSGEIYMGDGFGGANRSTILSICGANQSPSGVMAHVGIYSNDSQATNKGGSISFGGQDGSTAKQTFSAILGAKENSTSGNYAGYMSFFTRPNGAVSAERMRIDSSGRVGIGTTSPAVNLDVSAGSGTTQIYVRNTATSGEAALGVQGKNSSGSTRTMLIKYDNNDSFRFATAQAVPITFSTSDAERMRILDNGRIGINITTSDAKVTVSENANLLQPLIIRDANNTNSVTHYIGFRKHDSEKGSIKGDRGGTSFNTTSDYRLKQNVTSISDGITRIKQLLPKKFSFIEDETNTLRDGFLAHEVSSLVPEAVDGTKDAVDSDNKPIYQGIDHSKLVPLLTAALKEAVTKIETLETKVAALEAA
jgi:hypothetical protein